MDSLWQLIEETPVGGSGFGAQSVLLSLVLAFVLGQVIAWVYYITHSGLSYSRSYVQSLVLITMVIAMVMTVIGNNIITAVGVGMATGSHRYATAITGTIVLCLIILYLYFSDFGAHEPHNGFLRFSLRGSIGPDHPVAAVLRRFCGSFTLISMQDAGFGGPAEYAYQLMIRNTARNEELISELEQIEGIENINLTMQEKLLEV
ncbi:MAG: hypothetical protein ACYTAS_24560 [Planctomycetota bacterium]|jgi:hypothetical protein